MDFATFDSWISTSSLFGVTIVLFGMAALAFLAGYVLRKRAEREPRDTDTLLTSSVLALLALLLSFTFSLASDRFDARRILVVQEANAIGTLFLRTQLLEEPHRSRISRTIIAYTDNRIALAQAGPGANRDMLRENDRLLGQLWDESAAAFTTIRDLDFSSIFYESVNAVIEYDALRKAARLARVPSAIFIVLFLYVAAAAAMLGFFTQGKSGLVQAGLFLCLLMLFLIIVVDIDQPTTGGIRESQGPVERMRATLQMR
jgi:hypothetical protein